MSIRQRDRKKQGGIDYVRSREKEKKKKRTTENQLLENI